jgi:hypothetical protein
VNGTLAEVVGAAVLVAAGVELDALLLLALLLLLLLLLELLLPHALTASARAPTAANVPDHALTLIRSSAFATCRRATGRRPSCTSRSSDRR